MSAKKIRLAHVNAVIKAISKYGRRFFWNARNQAVSTMLISKSGHIYFLDDYSNKLIYVAYKGRWRNFSHGGTLKNLIEGFANYIRTGDPIHIDNIGLPRRFGDDGYIWGYTKDAVHAVLIEVISSPVFFGEPT